MSLKKLLFIGILVALIVYGVKYFKQTDQHAFHELSKERAQKMFDNLKSGRSADQQDAIGYWRVGHPEGTDQVNLQAFKHFLETKGLSMDVQKYEYVSSELFSGDDTANRFVRLECKADGHKLSMDIRFKEPIEWAD